MTEIITTEPLIGRLGTVAAIIDCLLDDNCPGALILGDAGMGKTALVNEVLLELGQRVRPFRVYGVPTLSGIPFAALAPLLTSLTPGQINDPLSVLRALVAEVNPDGENNPAPAVLVVEDGHYLDDSSVAVLAQLAAAEAAKVVFLCRPHPAPPAEVFSMWSEGLVDRFELQPLTEPEANEVCSLLLGAPVAHSTSAVLCRSSGGNPLFLQELIEHARARGQLVFRNETWILLGETHGTSVRLTDLVRDQILQLTPGQRNALEAVALAEALPLSLLQKVTDSYAVDELQTLRFIDIAPDQARHVRLTQPIVGEVIRQLVPAARSISVRRRVVALMDSTKPETRDGLLRYVSWGLESGADIPDADILEAAQLANRLFIPSYVERVASAIRDPQARLAAQVEVARAKLYRGDIRGAASSLEGVIERTSEPRTIRQASRLAAQLGRYHGGDANPILNAARQWEAALAKLEESQPGPSKTELDMERLGSRLLALEGLQAEGRHIETERELRHIWETALDEESRLVAGTLLAEALAVSGRPLSALQTVMAVQDLLALAGDWGLQYGEFVMRRHVLALLNAGEIAVLERVLKSHMERAPNSLIYAGGMLHLAAGTARLRRGDMGAALPELRQSVTMLRFADIGGDLPEAVAAAAYAASVLKRRDLAGSYADEYMADMVADMRASLLGQAYAVAAKAEQTGTSSALVRLTGLADSAAARGAVTSEMEILVLALRLGDLTVVNRLGGVAAECEGRSAEFIVNYCRALVEKDANRLIELSDSAARDGMELAAADCAGQALRILESRGDKARQFEAQKLVKRRAAALDRSAAFNSKGPFDAQKLTRREQEIADLVHSGTSNRDIAIKLGLSLRTVEGHLYRMFAKLGISHREDLSPGPSGTGNGHPPPPQA